MGIDDSAKALEGWLAGIAPAAFTWQLPADFRAALVVQDLSALLVAAFFRKSVRNGIDFVQQLSNAVREFTTASSSPPIASTSDSVLRPSEEEIEEWRRVDPERFCYAVAKRCTFVLCKDDSRYVPYNRRMVHESRYASNAKSKKPYTEDELRHHSLHVCEHRAMPGFTADGQELDGATFIRSRAGATAVVRDAYQSYGTWALAASLDQHVPTFAQSNDSDDAHRRVVIEPVRADFPHELYAHTELVDLPSDWARGGRYASITFDFKHGTREEREPPAIGEADLKILWYLRAHSAPGDDVLVRCADSDVFFLLLLHMRHLVAGGAFTRRVLLDVNVPNLSRKRYHRRFVCLNTLAETFCAHAAQQWPGLGCPLEVLCYLALSCGSDYTSRPYMVSPATIVDVFRRGGWRVLANLVRVAEIEQEDTPVHASTDAHVDMSTPEILLVYEEAALKFLRLLYQKRLSSTLKTAYPLDSQQLLSWPELQHHTRRAAMGKAPDKRERATVPTEAEACAEVRRLVWTLLYWSNGHQALGEFPTPHLDTEQGDSLWGWLCRRRSRTVGHGMARTAAHTAADDRMHASLHTLGATPDDDYVCCKARAVVPFDDLWTPLLADHALRTEDPAAVLTIPCWRHESRIATLMHNK